MRWRSQREKEKKRRKNGIVGETRIAKKKRWVRRALRESARGKRGDNEL